MAGRLPVDVAFAKPCRLPRAIDAGRERSESGAGVVNKAMAGKEFAARGDAEIASAGAARIRAVRPASDFPQRLEYVREGIALAGDRATLERDSAGDHAIEHACKVRRSHLLASAWRAKHRREANTVESHVNESIEYGRQILVLRRHCHARGNLHAALSSEQWFDRTPDAREAAAPAFERTQPIVQFGWSVEAHRHRETVRLEEIRVRIIEQRAVGGNGETELDLTFLGFVRRIARRLAQYPAIDERLAAHKGQIRTLAGPFVG